MWRLIPIALALALCGAGWSGSHYALRTADLDGDGFYETAIFPYDYDGDGTEWKTCDCGAATSPTHDATWICGNYNDGTVNVATEGYTTADYSAGDAAGNPEECRFNGERIWDDLTDDLNALRAQLAVGAEIHFAPGVYVFKGSDAVSGNCWDSATETFVDACQVDAESTPDLELAAVALHKSVHLVGPGLDADGEDDLRREGAWLVDNRGDAQIDNVDVAALSLGWGKFNVDQGDGIGPCDEADRNCSGATITANFDIAFDSDYPVNTQDRFKLCIDNAGGFPAAAPVGRVYEIELEDSLGANHRTYATLYNKATTCNVGGGNYMYFTAAKTSTYGTLNEVHQPISGAAPYDFRAFPVDSSVTGRVTGPLVKDWLTGVVEVEGFTFAPQDWWGSSTECDVATNDEADCDNGTIVGLNYGLVDVHNNAFLYGSNRIGTGYVDGRASGIHIKFRDNLVRYNRYAGLADFGSGWVIKDNTFIDNDGYNDDSYIMHGVGLGIQIIGNRFQNNANNGDGTFYNCTLKLTGKGYVVGYNHFEGNTKCHMEMEAGFQFSTVIGNNFLGASYHHIYVSANGTAATGAVTVIGNTFHGSSFVSNGETLYIRIDNTTDATNDFMGMAFIGNTITLPNLDSCFVGSRDDDAGNAALLFTGNVLLDEANTGQPHLIGSGFGTLCAAFTAGREAECGDNISNKAVLNADASRCL